jgi:hypothetical protein
MVLQGYFMNFQIFLNLVGAGTEQGGSKDGFWIRIKEKIRQSSYVDHALSLSREFF